MDICGIISASSDRAPETVAAHERKNHPTLKGSCFIEIISSAIKNSLKMEKGHFIRFFRQFFTSNNAQTSWFFGYKPSDSHAILFLHCLFGLSLKIQSWYKEYAQKSPPPLLHNPDFLIDFRLLLWFPECSLEHDFHLKRVLITPNGSKPRKTARISRRNGLYKSVWRIPYVRVRANLIYISAGPFSLQNIASSMCPHAK